MEDYRTLRAELFLFDPFMEKKQHLIAVSKLDTVPEEEREELLKNLTVDFKKDFGENIIGISSVSGYNIPELKRLLYNQLHKDK